MSDKYASYTKVMDQPPPEGRLWVPDDKARTMAWDVSDRAYPDESDLSPMASTHWRQVTDTP